MVDENGQDWGDDDEVEEPGTWQGLTIRKYQGGPNGDFFDGQDALIHVGVADDCDDIEDFDKVCEDSDEDDYEDDLDDEDYI